MGKLRDACRKGGSIDVYKALRDDMAARLESVESGRDYAAIVKSFVDVQERIESAEPQKGRPIVVNRLGQAAAQRSKAANG